MTLGISQPHLFSRPVAQLCIFLACNDYQTTHARVLSLELVSTDAWKTQRKNQLWGTRGRGAEPRSFRTGSSAKTECGYLHGKVIENGRTRNPLNLCTAPLLVRVRGVVHRSLLADPQCVQLRNVPYNNKRTGKVTSDWLVSVLAVARDNNFRWNAMFQAQYISHR